jgi:hypothetical protein
MTTSLLDACRRVDADLRTAGLSGRFALFSLRGRSFVYGESSGLDPPDDFGDQGYVLTAFGTQLLLDEEEDFEVMAVELSSALQDLVIDQLGRGWPEQAVEGLGSILTPAVVDRRACWTLQGRPLVVLGELTSTFAAEA